MSASFTAKLGAWGVLGYLVTALAMAAVFAFVLLLSPVLVIPNAGVLYLLVVLAAALWLGTGPGILALVLALLAVAYFYGPRDAGPAIFASRLISIAAALVAGIVLGRWARRQGQRAWALAKANADLYRESAALAATAQQHVGELNALLESLSEGVTIVDGAGRVLMLNETGKRLWQPPGSEALWTPEWYSQLDIRSPDGRPMPFAERPINRALRGERFAGYELLYVRPDGQRQYLSFSGSALRNERGEVVMAVNVYRNITQLRELEGLKDEFLEVAAHELKTPIAVLKGYAQNLLRFPEGVAPRYRKSLESIDRQTSRIDALVRDLLDVSRLRAGAFALRRELIDIGELAEMAANQAALRTARHKFQVHVPGPVFVLGDRERLEQVLNRLLDNAIRYTPAGGEIDVSVSPVDGSARVAVRDPGVGIPAEKQEHIFERFYRAHTGTAHDFGGMGVGLFIAREIVRGLGGDMGFESKVDGGSTFYFTLPIAEATIAAQ